MNLTRATASAVLILRVAYGVPVRGLGTRDALLHAGALIAMRKGAALRPWLAASIAGAVDE